MHRAKLVRNALFRPTPPPLTADSFARGLLPGRFAVESDGASSALIERLSAAEIADVQQRIDADAELGASYRGTGDPSVARDIAVEHVATFEREIRGVL